jgi:hypothetical protein
VGEAPRSAEELSRFQESIQSMRIVPFSGDLLAVPFDAVVISGSSPVVAAKPWDAFSYLRRMPRSE